MAEIKIIATNKKANFQYEILERYTAGIVLTGSEIKSVRSGKINFVDSYVIVKNREAFIKGLHIAPYKHGGYANHEPTRERKLLLNKNEIYRIEKRISEKGLTVVPLKCFISENGYAKIEIAVVKGKKAYDKREAIKKRDQTRDIERNIYD